MNKEFELKDLSYYSDLMYEIQCIAGFDVNADFDIQKRVASRKKDIKSDKAVNEELTGYQLSPFQLDVFAIVRRISKKANISFASIDEIKNYPLFVLEELVVLENKNYENILINYLVAMVKEMELEHAFSLGENVEQCVCLNKNKGIWEVYIVERGMTFEKDYFEDCYDACLQTIHHLADSKQTYEETKEGFALVRMIATK